MADNEQSLGLSLEDLAGAMYSEVENINPNADLTDNPPPPPENENGYLAIPSIVLDKDSKPFKLQGDKAKGQQKPGFVGVDWVIQDPGQAWDGQKFRTWPGTRVQRSGISECDQIMKAYYGQAGTGMTDGQKLTYCYQAIVAQKPLRIVLEWRAEREDPTGEKNAAGYAKTKTLLYGMSKFPVDPAGNHVPLTKDPADGAPVDTRARVTTYKPA